MKVMASSVGKAKAKELIVQYGRPEDPSAEQTALVRDLVKKHGAHVRLVAELPGAVKVAVVPETEATFRKDVAALPDWTVATEGAAQMPTRPLPESEPDDDKTR